MDKVVGDDQQPHRHPVRGVRVVACRGEWWPVGLGGELVLEPDQILHQPVAVDEDMGDADEGQRHRGRCQEQERNRVGNAVHDGRDPAFRLSLCHVVGL